MWISCKTISFEFLLACIVSVYSWLHHSYLCSLSCYQCLLIRGGYPFELHSFGSIPWQFMPRKVGELTKKTLGSPFLVWTLKVYTPFRYVLLDVWINYHSQEDLWQSLYNLQSAHPSSFGNCQKVLTSEYIPTSIRF